MFKQNYQAVNDKGEDIFLKLEKEKYEKVFDFLRA